MKPVPLRLPGNSFRKLSIILLLVFLATLAKGQWVQSTLTQGTYCLAVKDTYIFAGGPTGVYRSGDHGATWTKVHTKYTSSLVVKNNDVFSAGDDPFDAGNNGVYRSSDNGATWTQTDGGLSNAISLANYEGGLFLRAWEGLYRSTDNGATWTKINGWPDAARGTSLFSVRFNSGIYKSTDNGISWTKVSTDLPDVVDIYGYKYKLSFDAPLAAIGSTLYANVVFADSESFYGIYRSDDNGVTWTPINNYSLDRRSSHTAGDTHIRWLKSQENLLLAGTNYFGLFQSKDGGDQWSSVNKNLPVTSGKLPAINDVATLGSKIFIATGSGVWSRALSEVNKMPTITGLTPASGPVGTTVKITGTNFDPTPANNRVIFGTGHLNYATVNSSTATTLSVTANVGGYAGVAVGEFNIRTRFLFTIKDPVPTVSVQDSLSLVAIYNSAKGGGWKDKTNWLTGPADTWYGVTVANNRVTGLNLTSNQLSGTIPTDIASLTQLTLLGLGGNALTGAVPSGIGSLTKLTGLYLWGNQLSGAIPDGIGNLTALTALQLSENKFTGAIPSTIGNLKALVDLRLDSNQLSGALPSALSSLTNLKTLLLSYNQFTGSIPATLGALTRLEVLALQANQFTGSLPSSFGSLKNLTGLSVRNNQLSGAVPPEIASLTKLGVLRLDNNQLTGLPDLTGLSAITEVNASNNYFTFEDLEPNVGMAGMVYTPQKNVPAAANVALAVGDPLSLSYAVGGSANQYQWKKDGINIGTNAGTYQVVAVAKADAGSYQLEVTNSLVPDLTLTTDALTVTVGDEAVTGVEQGASHGIKLYPNPVEDLLTLYGVNETAGSILSDVNGKEHRLDFRPSGSSHQADAKSLTPGLYVLHLRAGNSFRYIKFIKK